MAIGAYSPTLDIPTFGNPVIYKTVTRKDEYRKKTTSKL